MKKIVKYIAVMLLLLATQNNMQAQYSNLYYHQTGDTIEWKSEIGYYAWWEFKPFFEQNLWMDIDESSSWLESEYDSVAYLMQFYTPVPLKIIGVAGLGVRGRNTNYPIDESSYSHSHPYIPDTDGVQEYYYIYDADNSGMTLKAKVPWSPFDPGRTLHVKVHNSRNIPSDSCCGYYPQEYYLPLHEYYFDSAFYVTDSFYVGYSVFGNIGRAEDGIYGPISNPYDTILTRYRSTAMALKYVCEPELQDPFCVPKGRTCVRYRRPHQPQSLAPRIPFEEREWEVYPAGFILTTYPIVEVDTTVPPVSACPPVSNVQVVVSGTTATVTWDDFPNYSSVLLSYGPCNLPQNQWQTVEVAGSTLHTLTGLNDSTCYKVKMKAACDTNKRETPWCTPVIFLTSTDSTVSIGGEPTALSQLTFLAPNPAHGEIVVSSSFNLQEIDIWTVDGVWVHHQPVAGHRATVPIDFLRPGTYIVAIRTHDGTTHKKLLVQ